MSQSLPLFRQRRARRVIALLVAAAVLLAGIAQAAHFHKSMLAWGGDTHCLSCLHSASAAPPAVPTLAARATLLQRAVRSPSTLVPHFLAPTFYQPRGPPPA